MKYELEHSAFRTNETTTILPYPEAETLNRSAVNATMNLDNVTSIITEALSANISNPDLVSLLEFFDAFFFINDCLYPVYSCIYSILTPS